jgi:prenyltransferase beta subunit
MRRFVCLAIVALVAPSLQAQTPDQKLATVKFLQELQVADGGFVPAPVDGRLDQNPRGGLRATSAALRALKYFGGAPNYKKAAAKFVENCWDDKAGYFADAPGGKGDVFTTAVGLMAVAELGLPMEQYRGPALKFLAENAKEFEEVRMAAAGMEAAGKREESTARRWTADLQAKANSDGSYGKGAERFRATGGTTVAILRLGGKPVGPRSVIEILDEGQNKDGGFGKDDTGASDLESSYRILRCYHMLGKQPPRPDALREFIAKCRNADAGYGVQPGKPSQVSGSYYAGIILAWLNEKQP